MIVAWWEGPVKYGGKKQSMDVKKRGREGPAVIKTNGILCVRVCVCEVVVFLHKATTRHLSSASEGSSIKAMSASLTDSSLKWVGEAQHEQVTPVI